MIDRAFGAALRNFSTLFVMAALLTVPLHLAYSVAFKNVIETRELHDVIETFPEARQVRGVGKAQLTQARLALLVVSLVELAAIPLLARAARRVLDLDAEGEVTSALDALRSRKEAPPVKLAPGIAGPVLIAIAIALAIGILIERSGLLLLEFVSDQRAFPFFGLMQGVSRAAAAPFLLATLAEAGRREVRKRTPTLY